MTARVVSLARKVVSPAIPAPVDLGLPRQVTARQHLWRGASGQAYVHTVYGLIECPPLPMASYILARRNADGRKVALHVGLASNSATTLNLAEIRQRGAQLGANEVHVYFQAPSSAERALVASDLRAGQFGGLEGEARHAAA